MIEKKKVLYVIDTLYSAGAEKSLLEISRNFSRVIPIFVHIYEENALAEEFKNSKIKVYSLNINGPWNLKTAQKKLKEVYAKELPDIIHATLFRSQIITRRLKTHYPEIPLVNSFVSDSYSIEKYRGVSFYRKIKAKFIHLWDRISARKVDFFVSNSYAIKESMQESLGIKPEKVKVLYRGRDPKIYLNPKKRKEELARELNIFDKQVILNVGRLIETKRVHEIVEIMPRILKKFPNTVLVIAGEGVLRNRIEILVKNNHLEENVLLLGNRSDIPALLNFSDVFVFPTSLEGLPGALIEAMLSKIAICCSNIPVNLECVDNNSAAIFEVRNKEDMYLKLISLLRDKELANHKAVKAQNAAIEKFNIDKITAAYELFYQQILDKTLE